MNKKYFYDFGRTQLCTWSQRIRNLKNSFIVIVHEPVTTYFMVRHIMPRIPRWVMTEVTLKSCGFLNLIGSKRLVAFLFEAWNPSKATTVTCPFLILNFPSLICPLQVVHLDYQMKQCCCLLLKSKSDQIKNSLVYYCSYLKGCIEMKWTVKNPVLHMYCK